MVKDDVNNAALALVELERLHALHGAARRTALLFVADAAGTPLTCGDIDRIFNALAFATLPAAVARRRSFHAAACLQHRSTVPQGSR